jgi:hypothetical protein
MTPIVLPALLPDLAAFIEQKGRLPHLGDPVAPWLYRGWLLPYVVLAHGRLPGCPDRWGYHLRTIEAGRLLDEPIPKIAFGPPDDRVFRLLHDWSALVGRDPQLLERALHIERNARDSLTSVKGLGRSFSWEDYLARLDDLPLFGDCRS